MKQGLLSGISSAQCVEAYVFFGEVDFATDQSMRPVRRDCKGLAEQMCPPVFVGTAQEDHRTHQSGVQVQIELRCDGAALGRQFSPSLDFHGPGLA